MLYHTIVDDLGNLPNLINHYSNELIQARQDCKINGNLEKNLRELPGITEERFRQLQDIEAVLQFLEITHRKTKHQWYRKYFENYNRALSSREAEKYADMEDDVTDLLMVINEVALLRNQYLGIMKGLENKNYNLGHITALRKAGLEDANL